MKRKIQNYYNLKKIAKINAVKKIINFFIDTYEQGNLLGIFLSF